MLVVVTEYMRFAREHRLLYEALLVPRPPAGGVDTVEPEQLWLFVLGIVTAVSGKAAAHEATVALWAFLHGMASLQSVNAFNDEKPLSSLEFGLLAWMQAAQDARLAEENGTRGKSGHGEARATVLALIWLHGSRGLTAFVRGYWSASGAGIFWSMAARC